MSRWIVPEHFKVIVGGNTYVDTPIIVQYKGASLFELRRSTSDGYLGINFDLHDAQGKRVGTVRNGKFVPPTPPGYTPTHLADHYTLVADATRQVICEIKLRQNAAGGAELDVSAQMYMPDGFLLQFNPNGTNLPRGITIRGNVFTGNAAAIVIG